MNKLMIAAAVAAPLVATAGAVGGYQYKVNSEATDIPEGYARVLSAEPVVKEIRIAEPRQSCWKEKVVTYEKKETGKESWKTGATMLGALIGGAIGHQIGDGRGQDVATVAGAAIGGKVGHDVYKADHKPKTIEHVTYEQRCKTVNDYRTETKVDGYAVTYEYQGQVYNTEMDTAPESELIPVKVNIAPQAEA